MAFSKADHYPEKILNQATWARIQSHPARIRILEYLLDHGPSPYFDLNRINPELSGEAVSRHIRYLRAFFVVITLDKHPKSIYAIDVRICNKLATLLAELQSHFRR